MPLLCSECPGWVCFAEKRERQIIPHLSKVKTPMEIAKQVHGGEIHIAFMPCFDKKLEGTRENNTDLVLTTVELI